MKEKSSDKLLHPKPQVNVSMQTFTLISHQMLFWCKLTSSFIFVLTNLLVQDNTDSVFSQREEIISNEHVIPKFLVLNFTFVFLTH